MHEKIESPLRRRMLSAALACGAGGTLARFALPPLLLAAGHAGAQTTSVPATGTHVVLLGTQGGPNLNPTRGEQANAVVVDGHAYLVDCGYGTLMQLRRAGLNFRTVGHVFLTHLHDDHTSDVAALLSHQWTDGRIEPTQVVGPYGTAALVNAALEFTVANATIRIADEHRKVHPEDIFSGRDIEATPTPRQIFADDNVTVSAVENTHFPAETKGQMPYRSVSYRFDTRDRKIAFSGDTTYSEGLIALAQGADILVCETIEPVTERRTFDVKVANGSYAENPEGVWAHIIGTHTTTEDAGRMAAAAGVKKLVLSHLLPGALDEGVADDVYLEGVRKHFTGEVVVGKDLMII